MPKVYLSFEGVVLLTEILLPVMVRVAPPVPPFKSLVCGHVDVLEVVVPGVAAVRPRSGYGQPSWHGPGAVWEGKWIAGDRGHQAGEWDLEMLIVMTMTESTQTYQLIHG